MEVRMNGRTEKPSHLFTGEEPTIAPDREKWSEEARKLDDLVAATKSDVCHLGYGGVSNGCGGGWDEGTLDCAPELSLHLASIFTGEVQYLPSVHLSVTGYRKISFPLERGAYRGVGTIQGPDEEYLFNGSDMHMLDQLRLWRTGENIFAPLVPTHHPEFYEDMRVETVFYYRLEIFQFGIMLYGKVSGIPDGAERFMYELAKTTLPLFEAFRSLEPLYQHEDKDGKRLWIDQDLQSRDYYRLAENLSRDIGRAVKRIAKRHGMPVQNTHSLSAMFRTAPVEMFLRTLYAPLSLVKAIQYRSAGLLRHQIWKVKKLFR